MTQPARPDPERVLCDLKDFQRDTVEYVFRRMYLDANPTRRFLVADEVGLGKTLVARGLIARSVDYLWDRVRRIDVVYICSNADIAQQNIRRLRLPGWQDFPLASRITLLPLNMRQLRREHGVNFVSFTPGTSFDMHSSLGTGEERALLYHLLKDPWNLRGEGPKRTLQGGKSLENFEWQLTNTATAEIDIVLRDRFVERVNAKPELRARFEEISQQFRRVRSASSADADRRGARASIVGELRLLLAQTCLTELEPDLIFLDEFQRFKQLMDPTLEAGRLARQLFGYADAHSEARVVLLSATPYKMYTLTDEAGEDHYRDFVDTVRFLFDDQSKTAHFEQLLGRYRQELFRLAEGRLDRACDLKREIEALLREVMVRTERLALSSDRDGMLRAVPDRQVALTTTDIRSYLTLQQMGRLLGQPDVVEYWKSAPYLLNFMDGYKLKQAFLAAQGNGSAGEVARCLAGNASALLSRAGFDAYQPLDPANARLRQLLSDTVDAGAWRWLWLPPALPYYALSGAFAGAESSRFTKRLIFSSWRVAPKAIATLVSYEVERRMFTAYDGDAANTAEARRKHRPLLRLARDEKGGPGGMSAVALLYPSHVLAEMADPLRHALEQRSGAPVDQTSVLRWARDRIERALAGLPRPHNGEEDQRWYWAAPVLLDLQRSPDATERWWAQPGLAAAWAMGAANAETTEEDSNWSGHIQQVRDLLAERLAPLGRRPADLPEVLAELAVAGPGTVALRALARVCGVALADVDEPLRNAAAGISWGFRSLFNTPEVTALVRSSAIGDDATPAAVRRRWLPSFLQPQPEEAPYWRKVLRYCLDGCLQAVVDEYVHVLREYLGIQGKPLPETAAAIAAAMNGALTLRTSTLRADEIRVDQRHESVEVHDNWSMRTHFAVRFAEQESEAGQQVARKKQVVDGFNSPFWPFVLVTTAVGQEGLDFHCYAHAVVHWNLPANPVDLEQREGRVHRYKGHAIRKNIARRFGLTALDDAGRDPWKELFDAATAARDPGASDLVPYWIYPVDGGACIERHVPALPLSRDVLRAEALRRSLAVYRMAFGQVRQEDLVAYLLSHWSEEDGARIARELQINLEPPRNVRSSDR